MAYTKTVWKDRVVEKPRNYTMANNADGSVTLTPAQGVITEAGTPIIAANLNNIENKVDELDKLLPSLARRNTSAITYFVNVSTGSDSNDGLTANTAFKTIKYAIALVPNILQYDITISIADGVYNEDISVSGISGVGTLFINGTSRANTQIKSITGMQNKCPIYVQNLSTNISTTDTMKFYRCSFVYIYNCQNNASLASYAFVVFSSSRGWVKGCNPSYAYIGIQAMYGSEVLSDNNTGTGNSYVFYASASSISLGGTQPSGSNTPWLVNGGQVLETALSIQGNGYYKLPNGLLIQWGVQTVGTAGVTFNLPIAFTRSLYGYYCTIQNSGNNVTANMNAPSLSQLQIWSSSATGLLVNWFAIGI